MRYRFLAALVLAAATLSAQTTAELEITAEPHHRLVLENSYVRAFLVDIPPGQATLMHRHHHDYVYVVLGPAEISNDVEGKPPVQLKLQDGETRSTDGEFSHIVRDLGSTPFRNLTIELLQDAKARQSPPPKWDEERGLQILEGGTKDIMFVKDGVRVSETELRPGGMIPKHHHPGPHLTVAVTDLTLQSDIVGKGISPIALKAGEIKWFPGGYTNTIMNVGKQQAKFVTLEFH
jgi:quercetin dioxygenase-like cupin family protein